MKKCLICLCLLLCLFATAYAYPSLEDIGEYARVNNPDPNDRLNLRTGPGESYGSLGKYYSGTVAEILQGTARDEWVKVSVYPAGTEGWMKTEFLVFGSARDEVINVQPRTQTRGAVNLRTAPRQTAPVIELIPSRTGLTVLGVVGDAWTHVQWENLTGYVMTRYLVPFEASQPAVLYVSDPEANRRLNLREGPGKSYASLGLFPVGTPVEVLDLHNGWVRVRVGGLTGYMMLKYLR